MSNDHVHSPGPSGCGHPWAYPHRDGGQVVLEQHGGGWRVRDLDGGLDVLGTFTSWADAFASIR